VFGKSALFSPTVGATGRERIQPFAEDRLASAVSVVFNRVVGRLPLPYLVSGKKTSQAINVNSQGTPVAVRLWRPKAKED
jgi:hypothetical protein